MLGTLRRIQQNQLFRKDLQLKYAMLYASVPLLGLGITQPATRIKGDTRLAYNVVKACTDTLVAELCEDRPKASVLTQGAEWDLQQKAKKLEQFLDGVFYAAKFYEERTCALLDACIFGTGVVKTFADGDGDDQRVAYQRVFPWEIIVDDQEAIYGKPRNIYQRKWIDRNVVIAMFPDHEDKLKSTSPTFDEWQSNTNATVSDQLMVVEAWHLPPKRGGKDGRHVIAVENCLLSDDAWERDTFPFTFWRRSPPPLGFWGIGVAEELMGIQLEINILLQKIQLAHRRLGGSHWMVENGSKVAVGTLDNDVGSVIRYTGAMPQVVAPEPTSQSVYAHLETLYHKAFALSGIPEASANGTVPPQFDSGEAQRVYAQLKSKRFNVAVRGDHDSILEVARQTIDVAREVVEVNPDYAVHSFQKNRANRVKFLEADMTSQEAVLQMFPVNSLSKDPAEKIAQVEKMANAGWMDPDDAQRLLGFPDLDAEQNYKQASYNVTMQSIDAALTDGVYVGPEPYQDVQAGLKRVQMAYLDAKMRGAPEEKLSILRDWMMAADAIINPPPDPNAGGQGGAAAPASAGPPPGAMPPAGPPMPPPGPDEGPPMPALPGMPPQ